MARYSGASLYVSYNGTALSYVRNISFTDSANEIDASAATDTRETYVAGLIGATWDVEILDDDTSNNNYNALAPQTEGTLIIAPQGTASGKRKITINQALVLERNPTYPYDDVVSISASGRLNSAASLATY